MRIDFTDCATRNKTYGGSCGGKRAVIYDDKLYMIKFPSKANKNHEISYSTGCISEYIGSHIFNILGIKAQETLLGTYRTETGEKVVVACRDFLRKGKLLQDFASLKNFVATTSKETSGKGVELDDILYCIRNQDLIDPVEVESFFWDMFVVDAFIGNWDRHNGNWGFLYDPLFDKLEIAPVYDCGSSLFPQADEGIMRSTLQNQRELYKRVFELPISAFKINGKRVTYWEIIEQKKYKGLQDAICRITPRINMNEINSFIDGIEYISDLQRMFYKKILRARKNLILDVAIEKMEEKNKERKSQEYVL